MRAVYKVQTAQRLCSIFTNWFIIVKKYKRLPFFVIEGFWFVPFVFLALCAFALARPQRTIPPISEGRIVKDGHGRDVIIPEPFPGIVLSWDYFAEFLSKTHAIEAVRKAGGPRNRPKPEDHLGRIGDENSLIYRIFPRTIKDDSLWDFPDNLESKLANGDVGLVYLAGGAPGIYGFINVGAHPPSFGDDEEVIFTMTRVWNDVLGAPSMGEDLIARYKREYAELDEDVNAARKQIIKKPARGIGLVCPADEWSRLSTWGLNRYRIPTDNASMGFEVWGRESDAERILAMNPDFIILFVGRYDGFMRDSRWRGMDAVRSRRIYENVVFNRYEFNLDHRQLNTRWVAELAYPDIVPSKVRELLQRHYEESFNYALSDEELDELLNIESNHESYGYERFMRTGSK